ncbi:MAG: hypothetical protein OXI87_23585 [Albidovulum sp.]|nr:hypothetical protein [Albidovulum sp.]MDE0533609.1 hypothetical protein [Albidovulum sp.]
MRYLFLFVSCVFLGACFGGGGGSAPPAPDLPIQDTSAVRSAVGGQPLNMTSTQIRGEISRLETMTDGVSLSDIITSGGRLYAASRCSGAVCYVGGQRRTLQDLNLDLDYGPVMSRNGVAVVQAHQETPFGVGEQVADVLGGILDHSGFATAAEYYQEAGSEYNPIAYGIAIGDSTGSVPRGGSATWRGVVTGANMASYEGIVGDATLRADFSASNIDASFTNVHEMTTGADRASIYFYNVPFTSDGFARGSGSNRIEGKFYGPGHVEAAGSFRRGSIVGAFGAAR